MNLSERKLHFFHGKTKPFKLLLILHAAMKYNNTNDLCDNHIDIIKSKMKERKKRAHDLV